MDANEERQYGAGTLVSRRTLMLAGVAAAASQALPRNAFAANGPRPFKVAVPDKTLKAIHASVRDAKLPAPMLDDSWSTGMSVLWLKKLRDYWLNEFDWRAAEARINRHPQFIASVAGQDVHFYHVKGKGPSPKPVLMGHGWPYSIYSFADVIDRLTDPAKYGGDPAHALTIVAPSLPGYGYSSAANPPLGPLGTLRLWRQLMREQLGYRRFGVQGGDLGSLVAVYMAHEFPADVTAMHLNIGPVASPVEGATISAQEKSWRDAGNAFFAAEFDYLRMQGNKPMMIGAALQASPMATAAWIAEKYWSWTDRGNTLESVVSRDQLLTEIMTYVTTDTIASSFGMYRMVRDELHYQFHPGGKIATPTGLYLGPKEFIFTNPPREIAERSYNLKQFTTPAKGGHFPFFEQPKAFADDMLAFFATNATGQRG